LVALDLPNLESCGRVAAHHPLAVRAETEMIEPVGFCQRLERADQLAGAVPHPHTAWARGEEPLPVATVVDSNVVVVASNDVADPDLQGESHLTCLEVPDLERSVHIVTRTPVAPGQELVVRAEGDGVHPAHVPGECTEQLACPGVEDGDLVGGRDGQPLAL